MAIFTTISAKELERQAGLVFQGKAYKLFLAVNPGALTSESLASDWLAAEISGNGYSAITGTVAAGTYRSAEARFEMPAVLANFQASGGSFTYDTICLHFTGETYLHSITVETPSITLATGQAKAYTLTLAQDD